MDIPVGDQPDSERADLDRCTENIDQSLPRSVPKEFALRAEQPTMREVIEQLERQRGSRLGPAEAVDLIRADRDGR